MSGGITGRISLGDLGVSSVKFSLLTPGFWLLNSVFIIRVLTVVEIFRSVFSVPLWPIPFYKIRVSSVAIYFKEFVGADVRRL